METRDLILMIGTFCIGIFTGGYVYLVGFVPTYVDTTPDGFDESNSFMVVGEVYGACSECPVFRITDDRNFRFFANTKSAAASESITGAYPRADYLTLTAVAQPERLQIASAPIPNTCQSNDTRPKFVGYRFTVTVEGVDYELDSCTTSLESDSELFITLKEVFSILEDEERLSYTAEDFQTAGVIGYFFPELFK